MFSLFYCNKTLISGGLLSGPLMLALGVEPAVSAASSSFMIIFTASARYQENLNVILHSLRGSNSTLSFTHAHSHSRPLSLILLFTPSICVFVFVVCVRVSQIIPPLIASSLQYLFLGKIDPLSGALFAAAGFMGGTLGQHVVSGVVTRRRKQSILVFLLAGITLFSAIAIVIVESATGGLNNTSFHPGGVRPPLYMPAQHTRLFVSRFTPHLVRALPCCWRVLCHFVLFGASCATRAHGQLCG